MKQSKNQIKKKKSIVLPPGGPKELGRVHPVAPGQTVRRDKQGRHTVTAKGKTSSLLVSDDELVATPGGYRSKSHVHKVEAGSILRVIGSRLKKLDSKKAVVADYGAVARGLGRPPAPAGGWVTYGYWNNNTGTPISVFKTTWTVPPPPTTQSQPVQLIYLFNGIQNSTNILQPVLQWGASPAGGGNYWAVGSWFVGPPGAQAFYSELVQVNPGDILTGVITLTTQTGNLFTYTCAFQGLAGPSIGVENIEELAWCCETLEAYGITQQSDYPAIRATQFQSINIQTGAITPAMAWTSYPTPPATVNFGEHCTIPANSASNGEVDIYYQP